MELDKHINQPEGRRIEFKERVPGRNNIARTVIAFANDAGGEIFIGVRDNPREVTGINEEDLLKIEEQITNIIHNNCVPSILPEISFLQVHGKYIVKVEIFKGNKPPYYLRGVRINEGTYIRVGSTNRLADDEVIEELERQKRNIPFDAMPVYDLELDKLDIRSFMEQYKDKSGEQVDRGLLQKLELFTEDQGKTLPTNALVLLSDDRLKNKLFPYAKIECARFKGTVPGDFIDQKTIDIQIGLQAEQAYQFILRHISQGSEYEGVYRNDRWEYPVIAIREAIRNAVIHRDYSLKGKDIKIAIFDDKIEITSPGKLLPSIDFNDMESGQSDIRNKTLAPVFKRLGIIEQWGNGLRLIAEEMKAYPEIDLSWNEPGLGFRLSYVKKKFKNEQELQQESQQEYKKKRTITDDSGRLMVVPTDYDRLRPITTDYDQLGDDQKIILLFVLDNKRITRREAVIITGLGETRVKEIFNELIDLKLIIRKGDGRSTHYVLFGKEEKR